MAPRVLSFHYTLTNTAGQNLDSSKERGPLAFIEGKGHIVPGLEKEIVRMNVGEKKEVQVAAIDAYGEKEEDLLVIVPKSKLPVKDVKIGDQFQGGPDEHSPIFVVKEIGDEEVTLDGNHPLAGQDLIFQIEMTDIREATPDELAHGHAHGTGGHSH